MNPSASIVTALLLLLPRYALTQVDPVVPTCQGNMRGITMTSRSNRTFHAFLGVPFAKPPVGNLRFKAPEKPDSWVGTFNATQDGPMCIQKNYLDVNPQLMGQEDCLYLNVYTPNVRPTTKMEVMVYIHGGGFFSGTGASYLWGPTFLLDKDIVLVTLNYRLGVLGFLSTEDSASPGNFGLKDQVAAMVWVRNNIEALGGNPNCVTLFGQSAGGASVHLHMLSPLSAGLFHRAISQSGTALNAWAWPIDSLSIARRQATFAGCDPQDNTTAIVACLKGIDAKTLINSGDKFKFWSIDPLDMFGPAVENGAGAFLPANPFYLIETGQFRRIPWITGIVNDEGIIRVAPIVTNATLREDLNKRFSVLGPRLLEISKSTIGGDEATDYVWDRMVRFYMGNDTTIGPDKWKNLLDMFTDRSFVHAAHKSAKMHQRADHSDMYLYKFNYKGLYSFTSVFAPNTTTNFGVSHCDDLIYLFRLPLIFPDFPPGHHDIKMSEKLIQLWANFAKHGHPTPKTVDYRCNNATGAGGCGELDNEGIWKPVVPGQHLSYLEITAGPNLTMKEDWFKERMDFDDSLPLTENRKQIAEPSYFRDIFNDYM